MKEKLSALLICIFIALSTTGFIYAQWNDILTISSTMEFGQLTLRFVDPIHCWDIDDATKDVGKLDCYYTDPDPVEGYENLIIGITNAYPGYEAHCNFTLKNIGALTEHITGVAIVPGTGLVVDETYLDANDNPIGWRLDNAVTDEPVLYVYVYKDADLSLICNPLESGKILQCIMTAQVTDNAEECQTYSFQVGINYEQVMP